MAMWFLFIIAPSLASAEPNPAIRGADNSDVLKELGVDIQNDGKDVRERAGKSRRIRTIFCLKRSINLGRKYFDLFNRIPRQSCVPFRL